MRFQDPARKQSRRRCSRFRRVRRGHRKWFARGRRTEAIFFNFPGTKNAMVGAVGRPERIGRAFGSRHRLAPSTNRSAGSTAACGRLRRSMKAKNFAVRRKLENGTRRFSRAAGSENGDVRLRRRFAEMDEGQRSQCNEKRAARMQSKREGGWRSWMAGAQAQQAPKVKRRKERLRFQCAHRWHLENAGAGLCAGSAAAASGSLAACLPAAGSNPAPLLPPRQEFP